MKKIYLYPLWLRIWHWFNALLFFVLIISGVSLQYSNTSSLLMPFEIAMIAHNVAGITLSVVFLFYVVNNIISKNYKQYVPKIKNANKDLIKQARYYIYGIFKGEPHPFDVDEENKFNPLQRITYFSIMFIGVPLIIITGWLLMFPELAPEQIFGMGGVWPMALLHITTGFFLSLFFIGHIYLATHGETITANFKSMINGWHLHHVHLDEHNETDKASDENKEEPIKPGLTDYAE